MVNCAQHLARGPTPRAVWIDAYNAATAAGLIPPVPVALEMGQYPLGTDLDQLCSYQVDRCLEGQIYDAPAGVLAIAFDDGPFLEPSSRLYPFLKDQNQLATHFMTGSQIQLYPHLLRQAARQGHELGVHTWSHPALTTLTDGEIIGEIGWTMQIIFDLTGKVPNLWRPPYGDNDDRVRAIAKNVFGLAPPIMWRPNTDTYDWCISDGGGSACANQTYSYGEFGPRDATDLDNRLDFLVSLPKAPGLFILEHELSLAAVDAFMRAFPRMKKKGWKTLSVAHALHIPAYQGYWSRVDSLPFSAILALAVCLALVLLMRNQSRRVVERDEEKATTALLHGAPLLGKLA